MKQNIMMRRKLSRLLVTFFFLPSFVTLSAQTGGTQPQVLSSVLKTLPADKFEFNRQLKDFSVVGSTLHAPLLLVYASQRVDRHAGNGQQRIHR